MKTITNEHLTYICLSVQTSTVLQNHTRMSWNSFCLQIHHFWFSFDLRIGDSLMRLVDLLQLLFLKLSTSELITFAMLFCSFFWHSPLVKLPFTVFLVLAISSNKFFARWIHKINRYLSSLNVFICSFGHQHKVVLVCGKHFFLRWMSVQSDTKWAPLTRRLMGRWTSSFVYHMRTVMVKRGHRRWETVPQTYLS